MELVKAQKAHMALSIPTRLMRTSLVCYLGPVLPALIVSTQRRQWSDVWVPTSSYPGDKRLRRFTHSSGHE